MNFDELWIKSSFNANVRPEYSLVICMWSHVVLKSSVVLCGHMWPYVQKTKRSSPAFIQFRILCLTNIQSSIYPKLENIEYRL